MKSMNKKGAVPIIVLGVIALVLVWGFGFGGFDNLSVADSSGGDEVAEVTYRQLGASSTVTFNAYDQVSNSETEVWPDYYVLDKEGSKLIDGVNANTTTTFVGDKLTIMGEGSVHYVPKQEFAINNERPSLNLDAYTIITESSNTNGVTAFDSTMNGLTASGVSGNSSDYNISLGADAEEQVTIRIKNVQSNTRWDVLMLCTGVNGDVDDFYPVGSEWTKVTMPESIDDETFSALVPDSADPTVDYDACYQRSSTLTLDEWDYEDVNFVLEAGSTDPTGTSDFAHLVVIDGSYGKATNGDVSYGAYAKDSTENVSTVGLNEPTASPMGLTSGLAILVI